MNIGLLGGGILSEHFRFLCNEQNVVIKSFGRRHDEFDFIWDLARPFHQNSEVAIAAMENLDALVVFAGVSNPNVVESNPDYARKVNYVNTVELIRIANSLGIKVLFLSSVEVFDSPRPNREEDLPSPKNLYGELKARVEEELIISSAENIIVRTTWNIPDRKIWSSRSGRCPLEMMLTDIRLGTCKWASDYLTNPVSASDTARVIFAAIERNVGFIYHSAGDQVVSRYDLAISILQHSSLREIYEPEECLFRDLPISIRNSRAKVSILETTKTKEKLGSSFTNLPSLIDSSMRHMNAV